MKFPMTSDFHNISPAISIVPRARSSSIESVSSSRSERIIHDQIVVQSPSIVFVSYDPLVDNPPLSFKDIISRPDYKL